MKTKTNNITSNQERKTLVGTSKSVYDAQVYIDVKTFDGWRVLIPPFVTKQTMEDVGEETTRAIDSEWTFVLHRFF